MSIVVIEPEELRELIRETVAEAMAEQTESEGPEWYTLQMACERKGVNYNSAKSKRSLQPNGGREDSRLSSRRVWHRSTVEAWLKKTDDI